MNALRDLVNRFPRLKAIIWIVTSPFRRESVSSNYVTLGAAEAQSEAMRLRDAWQSSDLPRRQREVVERQLGAFRRGEVVDVFEVMRKALRDLSLGSDPVSLLEVGCSSGYYSEIVASVSPAITYAGCDYSAAFIDMARATYPHHRFGVEDATTLSYPDRAFDVVVSGCCLLHIPEYRVAVAETARVSRYFAIFHRTPVVIGQPEKTYRKLAYGIETVEIHFNEPEFLALLKINGFELISTHTLSETVAEGIGSADRTYVCRKAAA